MPDPRPAPRRIDSPNRAEGRGGRRPRAVVLHTTDGTFDGTIGWFRSSQSGVSAHYLVGLAGQVIQFVDEADTARHAGVRVAPTSDLLAREEDPNLVTIGIEFEDGGDPHGCERTEAQYSAGAALIRRICDRWAIPVDHTHVIGHREVNADKTCPGNLDIGRLLRQATMPRTIVGLLPVRNGAADLPGYLAHAREWCDALVALDDGSTDATRSLLEADPIVARVLRNPPRPSAHGWDDAANRNRLLAAAGELDPAWVVFVDVDERLDPEDAAALRELASTDGLAGCAYGLRHYRMWEERCDPNFTLVWRMFAWRPHLELPAGMLHAEPVPPDFIRIPTSIRLRHYGAADGVRIGTRRRKYAEADPAADYATSFAGMDAPPSQIEEWRPRPPRMRALETEGPTRPTPDGATAGGPGHPRVVCLLPVRNGERDLPGWLASAARIADAVVALDDGSTDGTGEILAASALVARVLANPVRPTYAGWDDAANRTRLLEAAGALAPDWILQLDADERIDPDDACALRTFLATGAEPDAAYGFRVFRMSEDLQRYESASLWAYRLFAYRPGLRLPDDRLHFVPVPVDIPPERRLRTTIRIQHLGSATQERRAARVAKYDEVDPERRFQSDYSGVAATSATRLAWTPRPAGFPVLLDGLEDEADLHALDPEAPVLSAVVISRDDAPVIVDRLRALVAQELDVPWEIIVAVSGSDGAADLVREHFPQVTLVELPEPALPGAARNAGLRAARGEIVTFPGSHVELLPGSLRARLDAHRAGHPMVTGTILNGTRTRAGWAAYFLDHSGALAGRPSGRLAGPPGSCSYDRGFLLEVGGFPADRRAGEDTVVNVALWRRGLRAWRAADVRLVHHNTCPTPRRLVAHHFRRGRALGRMIRERGGPRGLVRYLPNRIRAIDENVRRWGDTEALWEYRRARPLIAMGATAAWFGAIWGWILRR